MDQSPEYWRLYIIRYPIHIHICVFGHLWEVYSAKIYLSDTRKVRTRAIVSPQFYFGWYLHLSEKVFQHENFQGPNISDRSDGGFCITLETADLQGTTRRTEARCDSGCRWQRKRPSTDHVYWSNLIGSCHGSTIGRCQSRYNPVCSRFSGLLSWCRLILLINVPGPTRSGD